MMRILWIGDGVPFPPRNGRELTSAALIEQLAARYSLDLLIVGGAAGGTENVPKTVGKVWHVPAARAGRVRRATAELTGRAATYYVDGVDPALVGRLLEGHVYDLAWVSPIGCIGVVDRCKAAGVPLARRVAIGLNDVKTTLSADAFRQALSGRLGLDLGALAKGLRVPWVRYHERRYLSGVDLVHVQTAVEERRLRALKPAPAPRVVAAQNGRKVELEHCRYRGRGGQDVLFLTHLEGARARESRWFLNLVWPQIRAAEPDARLLLVGTPAPADSVLRRRPPPGVQLLGFVPDLVALYDRVAVAVVPTLHATGLINRVQDALVAGVPVVACSAPLQTIAGLLPGSHALAADRADGFAAAVVRIMQTPTLANELSSRGRALVRQHPTWPMIGQTVAAAIEAVVGADHPLAA